jgi:hypothetical protein
MATMKEQEQIKALAELDGLKPFEHDDELWSMVRADGSYGETVCTPNYLTSYDAIIPLVQKQCKVSSVVAVCFANPSMNLSPAYICEALLRATGKWIE